MLEYKYTQKEMEKEYFRIKNEEGDFKRNPNTNRIVLTYQPHFFKRENELWEDPKIREKLTANRVKYLSEAKNKQLTDKDLSEKELLRGFKISGIHRSYSHHSPFWIKAFIEKYDVKSIYDPCGGWGHRLLGAMKIPYIYNDADSRSVSGVKNITSNFFLKNKYFYHANAADITPKEDYEAVFTCPPYYDREKYYGEYDSLKGDKSYFEWLQTWWSPLIKVSMKPGVRLFSFIMSNEYKDEMKEACENEGLTFVEEISVGSYESLDHFQRTKSSNHKREFCIIFKR
jgi:hypothetical protein